MPTMPSPTARPRRRPTLRLATFNVAGRMRSSTTALAHVLVDLDLDVVALQEVKLRAADLPTVVHHLNAAVAARAALLRRQHGGFDYRAAPNAAAPASAGVMLLWRRALVRSGRLDVLPEQAGDCDWSGRAVAARLKWGGHTLQVVSVYCPNEASARKAFLRSTVQQVWQRQPQRSLLMGDWNFVPDPGRDRRSRQAGPAGDALGDRACAAALAAAAPGALDVYRARHPATHSYTFFSAANGHAARHDRMYACAPVVQHVLSCAAAPVGMSDHDPLVCELLPRRPTAASGRAARRVRLDFLANPALAQQFQQWLRDALGAAPSDAARLLAWWPVFKRELLLCMRRLHAEWRAGAPGLDTAHLVRQVQAAVAQLGQAATPQARVAALAAVAAARGALRDSQARVWQSCDRLQRQQWVHGGERPQPAITQQLRALGGGDAGKPVVLRAPGGGWVWEGSGPANLAVAHYASVSAQPPVEVGAQQAVLAAVRAAQPAGAVAADGAGVVQAAAVKAAMLSSRPGTAPGPDGLPLVLYKRFKALFLPVLARLFSAIGAQRAVPEGFLRGSIAAILKPGADPLSPVGYRPITLLNTDYRLLARVLADRLQAALQSVVSPCQTAFLKGRRSGANILALQLLMDGLPANSEVVAALLDVSKAYDTIDRSFLLSVMAELGVGQEFISWVATLLSDTSACVVINGHASMPRLFVAGVRQGCPLSPLLYLCVAEALLRFLQHKGIGVEVLGVRLCATQFADDTQVFLSSPRQVPAFLDAMRVFSAASGQRLNASKTKVLLVGQAARAQLQALQQQRRPDEPMVVDEAVVLGVPVGGGPAGGAPAAAAGSAAFEQRLPGVLAALKRLQRLAQLSAFGRGLGTAAYGVSKLLYAAEYDDVPSDAQLRTLQAAVARLVDRGEAHDAAFHGFPGVKAELLAGQPARGGFGVLPWREHIVARHAWWGAQLLSAPVDSVVPWVCLARAMLRRVRPWFGPLAALDCGARTMLPQAGQAQLPAPLRRMLAGLRALGRMSGTPPAPGPWCADAPVWGNPLAPAPEGGADGRPRGLQGLPGGGYARELCLTVGDVVRACRVAIQARATNPYHGPWADAAVEARDLARLLVALPRGWQQAAEQAIPLSAPPSPLEVHLRSGGHRSYVPVPTQAMLEQERMLVSSLGWHLCGRRVSVAQLSVKKATALQLGPLCAERMRYLDAFVSEVGTAVERASAGTREVWCRQVLRCMREVWRLKWDNHFKEVFWRLAHNGLATGSRMRSSGPCGVCGWQPPEGECVGRLHHFWECPVAQAVVRAVAQQLPPAWCTDALRPAHILFMHRPEGASFATTVDGGVWRVVCLAAVNAMDAGRRAAAYQCMVRARAAAAEAAAATAARDRLRGQRLITDLLRPAAPTPDQLQHRQQVQQRQQQRQQRQQQREQQEAAARLATVKAEAVARFWELLQDFVVVQAAPASWADTLAADHPFLQPSTGPAGLPMCAVVVRPEQPDGAA